MNEDKTKLEVKLPLVTLDETIALDNYINEIVKEITELHLHDKDLALAQEIIKRLQQRINKAIEYIENHSLYEEEYDYDYEENSYLSGIDDEQAKRDLLEILKGDSNEYI